MSLVKEFKEFALKGNVLDLAVGVIIGGAFGNIVNSLINDIIMPVVGKFVGDVDFKNLYFPLSEKVKTGLSLDAAKAAGPVMAWGNFVTIAINFLILAFVLFMVIKAFNTAKRRFEAQPPAAPAVPPPPTKDQVLLAEIRDLLKSR